MSKFFRQNVVTLPKQSLTAMKVAFGVRAQYTTILTLSLLMATQVIGVVIFSGKALANGSVTLESTITSSPGYTLTNPISVAVGPDDSVYVAENADNYVYKYDSAGTPVATIGNHGAMGELPHWAPTAVTVDTSGNVFVFESGRTQIQKYDASGVFVTSWGSAGSGNGQFGTGGATLNGMSVAPNGDVYVADDLNNRIQVFSNDGTFIRSWTNTEIGMTYPRGVTVDTSGNVWVCSLGEGLQKFTSTGRWLDSNAPYHHCFQTGHDRRGNIYTIDEHGIGFKINSLGETIASWDTGLSDQNGIAVNSQGKIYITDFQPSSGDQIRVYNDQSAYLGVITAAATNITGTSAILHGTASIDGITDSSWVTQRGFEIGTTTGYELPYVEDPSSVTTPVLSQHVIGAGNESYQVGLDYRGGISMDAEDNYYISNGKDTATTDYQVKKFGANGTTFLGGVGTQGDGDGMVTMPGNTAFDSSGNIYVLDAAAGATKRVQKFSSSGVFMTSWGLAGTGDGEFMAANGIAIDTHDNVYISDASSNRIQKFTTAGAFIAKWGSTGTGDGQFFGATRVAAGPDDSIYVLDDGNERVQKFTASGTYVTQWGGTGLNPNQFEAPRGLVVIGNYVYTIDYYQKVIKKFTTSGTYIGSLHPKKEDGSDATPFQLTANSAGDLVVLDANSITQSVYVYKTNQQVITYDLTGLTCDTTYHYRAFAVNAYGWVYGADQTFMMPCMQITTSSLVDGDLAQPYSDQIQTNIPEPGNINAVITSGALPAGLSLNSADGTISGTPTEAGLFTFTVQVTDSTSYNTGSDQKELSIFVNGETLQVVSSDNTAYLDQSYSDQVAITGGTGSPVYTLQSGEFPPGISMDSSGAISGTPTQPGDYTATVLVTEGPLTASGTITIHAVAVGTIYLAGSGLPPAQVGTAYANYDFNNNVSYGFGYKTFQVIDGSLPPGMVVDADGTLHGTPTAYGYYPFTLQVTDITGSASAQFALDVFPPSDPRANTPIVSINSPASNTVFDYLHDSVTVTGTGPVNQTITTYMDNYVLGTTTADSSGNWSYTASNVFPGQHSFDAKWIPSQDVAFIPFISSSNYSTDLRVVDAASRQIVKTIYLPQNSFSSGSTINHAGTKVYVSGYDYPTRKSTVWEYNIVSGSIRTLTLSDYNYTLGPLVVTSDDQYAYVDKVAQDYLQLIKLNLASFTIEGTATAIPMAGTEWNTVRSGYSTVPLALGDQSVYTSVSSTNSGTGDMAIINQISQMYTSITAVSEPRLSIDRHLIASSGTSIYTLVNKQLIEVDSATNTVLNVVAVNDLDLTSDYPVSLAVDKTGSKAYIGMVYGKIYTVNLSTEAVSFVTLAGANPYNLAPYGLRLTSDGSHLYIVCLFGSIQVLNTQTGQFSEANNLLATSMTGQTASYGDFIGAIAPPTATTSFSVGLAPETPSTETSDPGSEPEQPVITDVTPTSTAPAATPAKSNPITAPQTSITPQNTLFALAKRIPEPVAVGFPWFLLALALVLVGIQYYQVHSESMSTKRIQANVAKQTRLVEEQNNFVALSTHYLHTPLTIMEGEISLMVKAGTLSQQQATKLQATLTSLNAEAEAVLAQEEQNGVE